MQHIYTRRLANLIALVAAIAAAIFAWLAGRLPDPADIAAPEPAAQVQLSPVQSNYHLPSAVAEPVPFRATGEAE